jgi:hypothetical protein
VTLEAMFGWGLAGSLAIELLTAIAPFYTDPITIPDRYRRVSFWVLRILLAIVGGGLPSHMAFKLVCLRSTLVHQLLQYSKRPRRPLR